MFGTVPAVAETKDVFDILGVSPPQVASSMVRALPPPIRPSPMLAASTWVGMPMTDVHRKEFMEALRRAHTGFDHASIERWDALLDLLEEDGRVEEALAFLPGEEWLDPERAREARRAHFGHSYPYALVRRAGFLIKAGKREDAARIVAGLNEIETMIQSHPWAAVVAVDVAMGRSKEAIDTLEFLLRETEVDPASFVSLAHQQIQLARSEGGIEAMTAADVPPALRAVRLDILGRTEEAAAVWRDALPSLSSTEMLRLLRVMDFKNSPGYPERMLSLLDEPGVSAQDKAALIRSFTSNRERLERFFGMKEGHDQVIRKFGVKGIIQPHRGWDEGSDLPAFVVQCDKTLEMYPMDPWLLLLRAACVDPDDPSHRASLVTVAQSGPAESGVASEAIEQLRPMATSTELDRIITQAPTYHELSAAERLQRFRAAELDQRVVETLDGLDFSKPEGDEISLGVGSYLSMRSQEREVPAWVVERILPILTPLCAGSPEKSAENVHSSIRAWFSILSRAMVPEEPLIRTTRELAAIVAEREISVAGDMFLNIPPDVRRAAEIPHSSEKPRAMPADGPPGCPWE